MADDLCGVQFKASSSCVLCRKGLPDPQHDPDQLPTDEAWQYRVLAFCDGPFGMAVIQADLANPDAFSELRIISKSDQKSLKLHISTCQPCEIDQIAHLIHLHCWKMVNRSMRTPPTTTSIYMFARSTYPLFDIRHIKERLRIVPDFTSAVTGQGAARTEVGQLLESLTKLPAEIQLGISANCAQTLLTSLLTATESSKLLQLMKHGSLNQSIVDLDCSATLETLSAHLVSIFGQRYLSLLSFNSGDLEIKNQSLIAVDRSEIRGIKFVIDHYGLRAISILYADNSTSSWLGDDTGGWKGVIYGDNLRSLRIIRDDLKYLRIDFAQDAARARHPVMWDKDLHFLNTHTHQILDTVSIRSQIRSFPGWRLCYYLPLIDDRGYISGLTIYCHHHGVTGIISHGQSDRLIGSRRGCPIHLHLSCDERIISVWLRTPGDFFDIMPEPTILVTTTHNSTCIFGPYLSPNVTRTRQYGWTNLCESSGIVGLFYDALSVSPSGQITSVGITRTADAGPSLLGGSLPRILVARNIPVIDGTTATGLFVSIGTFSYVQRLQVRKVGGRCTGMCIHHSNGTIEVLGQWDPSQYSTISDIYTKDNGIVTSVNFHLSGLIASSYVQDITIGLVDKEPLVESRVDNTKVFFINQSIAWWFTEWYDCVLLWDGTNEEITVSASKHRIIELG